MKNPVLVCGFVLLLTPDRCWSQALPPAPGSYTVHSATETREWTSFHQGDRLVATYYFYWYKWKDACVGTVCDPTYTRSHIEFATGVMGPSPKDALTDHPPDLEGMDFSDPEWHRKQIERIREAGIDIILPVFWGVPGRYDEEGHYVARWSAEGLRALSTALESLEEEGRPTPRVGMFYDTTTLSYESPFHYKQGVRDLDLTTARGKKHFYATIRDFFSLIPPCFWALWEGHPIVWLYASAFAGDYDETLLPDVRRRFSQDFGGLTPWFVANLDWEPRLGPDWVYRWGGAILPTYLSVNSVGPGFDNSGAHGKPRGSRVEKSRDEGKFYQSAWERALRSRAPVTVVETWNELHEGTEICPTVEHGNRYVQTTRRYSEKFKNPSVPALPGPFLNRDQVSWNPADKVSQGLKPVQAEDGKFQYIRSGTDVTLEVRTPYLYFDIDDSFCFCATETVLFEVEIEYFDLPAKFGSVRVEYDSWNWESTLYGIYQSTEETPFEGTFRWRKTRFRLTRARFANNQNQGADFRFVIPSGLRVRSVVLRKKQ